MKRRLQSLLVMIICIITFPLSSFAYDFEVDNIYYKVISLDDMTCETVGCKQDLTTLVIPADVSYRSKTFKVVKIGHESDEKDYKSITNVEIPNSVIEVGDSAFFNCSSLTSIDIPNSVIKIGKYAFLFCESLQSVEIPNSVIEIGKYAFRECRSLQSVEIPNSVTRIYERTFSDCRSLQSVEIPNSVTSIYEGAFSDCYSLQSVEIPNSVTRIDEDAFRNCSSLTSVKIPNSVRTICKNTFKECSQLQSITISASVDKIYVWDYGWPNDPYKSNYFYGCDLKNIRLEGNSKSSPLDFIARYGLDLYELKDVCSLPLSFFSNVKYLYIDRSLRNNLHNIGIETLEIGPNSENLYVDIETCSVLKTLICHAIIPPTIPECTNAQYMDMELIVPDESLDLYKKADVWKNFWNIVGFSTAGSENISTEVPSPEVVSRYSLDGQKVDENYKGVVVVRFSDGSTKKIMQ